MSGISLISRHELLLSLRLVHCDCSWLHHGRSVSLCHGLGVSDGNWGGLVALLPGTRVSEQNYRETLYRILVDDRLITTPFLGRVLNAQDEH